MSEQQPQKQTPDQLDQDLLSEEQGPQYEIVEEEPQAHVGTPFHHDSESSVSNWATAQRVDSDPTDFTKAVASSYEALGDFGSKTTEEKTEAASESTEPSTVDSIDKGLGKGNVAPKPEEDVDAAREAVKKSLESEEEATEEPTADKRAEASAKIGQTAEAAARPVKQHRSKQDRKTRGQDASRGANARAEARGEAKRAAKAAAAAEAPQTPPIMGEGGVKNEKQAKQTVVTEGTDGQQYVTEPTTQPPKRARVSAEDVKATVGPAPEAIIPTQPEAPEEPVAPAEERKVVSGTIVPGSYGSAERSAKEFNSLVTDSADFLDMDLNADAPKPVEGPTTEEVKVKSKPEEPVTTTAPEDIDDDVLAAMGGADTGRPAKRGGRKGKNAHREETPEAATTSTAPVSEPEASRRPSPADMPGARKKGKGPTPASMPRRRPTTHAVNGEAPDAHAPEAPKAPAAEKPAAPSEEVPVAKPEAETTREKWVFEGAMATKVSDRYLEDSDNEDRAMVNPEKGYMGVFDGMGGHAKGGEAAEEARNYFEKHLGDRPQFDTVDDAKAYMNDLMLGAHRAVESAGQNDGEKRRATTANVAMIEVIDGQAYAIIGNAGDSLLFVSRDGEFGQVSQNQSTNDPTSSHPDRFNLVTNSLGGSEKPYSPIDPDHKNAWAYNDQVVAIKLKPGDKLISVSDGITGDAKSEALSPEELEDAFGKNNPEEVANRLIEVSSGFDKKTDDKTVSVLFVHSEVAAQPTDETSSDDAPEYETEEVNDEVKRILKKYENGLDVNNDADESSSEEEPEEVSDLEAELLKTAGERDTRTPEEVEAADEAEAQAKEAAKATAIADDTLGSMHNSARNRLGGFGDRSRGLGSMALGGENTSWADELFNDADDLDDERSPLDVLSREPLDDPFGYLYRDSADTNPEATSSDNEKDDDDDENNGDDGDAGRSLADDLLGDADFEPVRRNRRERVGAAFRTGWDKARTYFTGRDNDRSISDRDRRIAGRQLKVVAGAVGATVLAGALFSGLAGGDTASEGPKHVGKGPSASAEKTPGAKVDSGNTESKPKESLTDTGSDKKESKKPRATVDDDHRHEHGTGTGSIAHTFDVGRETVKVSADNEVVVTLKQGGTVWDALDKIGDELHINHSDEDVAETIQSMHLKPGQDRQMKVGSSYTFKVQGGKLVAKK